MSTDHEDELQRAYRDASSDAAGAPPAALRKAILAEAAAAAKRRQPANDSRYWLSAAAGVAVLGVGLVLWRQVPHQLPGNAPLMAEVVTDTSIEAAAPQASVPLADAPAPASQPLPAPAPPEVADAFPQLAREQRSAEVAEPAAKAEPEESLVSAAADRVMPPPAAPPAAAEEVPAARSRAMEAQRNAPVAAATLQDAAGITRNTSTPQLLRQYFPEAIAGSAPRTLWLVQDAAGNRLRSGELAVGQEFSTINPGIEAEFNGQRLGPWVIEEVRGARGQSIKLGIARLQYNPGQ
jgi:hypothetical protein